MRRIYLPASKCASARNAVGRQRSAMERPGTSIVICERWLEIVVDYERALWADLGRKSRINAPIAAVAPAIICANK